MASSDAHETRAVIKFCCQLGYSQTKTYETIQKTSMESKISRIKVFLWHYTFCDGRLTFQSDNLRGRKSSVNATLAAAVKDVVYEDRRFTIHDVCELSGQSYGTVQRVITKQINMYVEDLTMHRV